MPDLHAMVVIASATVLLVGCRVDNALPKTNCVSTTDCIDGHTCQQGVCVALAGITNGDGGCESFPPATCSLAEGPLHPIDHSELLRLLPGRWLWCTGEPSSGTAKIGPSDSVGFEFNSDATLWWFLVDDGHGNPVHRSGWQSGGTIEILGMPDFVQLNLVESINTVYGLNVSFADGPPLHMRLAIPTAYYIHDESGCGGALDGPIDLGTSGGGDMSFGGACDPNVVTAGSCPAVGGVACSICQSWQCVQPCHLATNDCASPQTCVALDAYTLSGDCIGYDGYCQ